MNWSWNQDSAPGRGLDTQHAAGAIVLIAVLFLVAVRYGFRGVSISAA